MRKPRRGNAAPSIEALLDKPTAPASIHAAPPSPPARSSVPLMWTDHRGGFRSERRGEQAIEAFEEADKIDQLPWQVADDHVVLPREAAKFREVGTELLQPETPITLSHREVVPDYGIDPDHGLAAGLIRETLEKDPTSVAVGASTRRTEAAARVDVLEPALDAAESAQAANSLEEDALPSDGGRPFHGHAPPRKKRRRQTPAWRSRAADERCGPRWTSTRTPAWCFRSSRRKGRNALWCSISK